MTEPSQRALQMIWLRPGCHAKVHRTRMILSKEQLPPLLLKIWRDQLLTARTNRLGFKP
jgi:predicted HNH restriction endonuclease